MPRPWPNRRRVSTTTLPIDTSTHRRHHAEHGRIPCPRHTLRLADDAVLVIEQLADGQIQRTRIEPDGSMSVEVVPRPQ